MRDLDPTPAEVQVGGLGVVVVEDLRVQRVDDEPAVLLVLHQPGLPQHAQVVRDVDDLDVEQLGQLGHVLRAGPQALDDADAVGLGNRLQQLGTLLGLLRVGHDSVPDSRTGIERLAVWAAPPAKSDSASPCDTGRRTAGSFNHHTYTIRRIKTSPLNGSLFRRGDRGQSAQYRWDICDYTGTRREEKGSGADWGRSQVSFCVRTTGRRTAGRRRGSSSLVGRPPPGRGPEGRSGGPVRPPGTRGSG